MDAELSRTVPLHVDEAILGEQLLLWAEVNGFRGGEVAPKNWEFRRGSHWHAVYTFDIRKIPTRVAVMALPLSGQVVCTLRCGSWLTVQTPGDRARLESLLDSLVVGVLAAGTDDSSRFARENRSAQEERYSRGGDAYTPTDPPRPL